MADTLPSAYPSQHSWSLMPNLKRKHSHSSPSSDVPCTRKRRRSANTRALERGFSELNLLSTLSIQQVDVSNKVYQLVQPISVEEPITAPVSVSQPQWEEEWAAPEVKMRYDTSYEPEKDREYSFMCAQVNNILTQFHRHYCDRSVRFRG